jgi:hypothetical protein
MSASQISLPPALDDPRTNGNADQRFVPWWKRFGARCSAVDCPYRGKLWPAWLRNVPGLVFEGRWYCEPACLEPILEFRVRNLLSGFATQKTKAHRIPLGLLLVERGAISSTQLRQALRLQRQTPGAGRIGDWLCQMGIVREQQLAAALAQQWGCALFPLDPSTAHPSWSTLIPLSLLDSARAVPAYASPDSSVLHLAFSDRLDHPLLYAIEHMLDCRTVACVAPEAKIVEFLAYWRRRVERNDISFGTIRDPREMTRIISNYAAELQAVRVAVARASAHVWVRFYGRQTSRDLLFRMLPDGATGMASKKFSPNPKAFSLSADTRKDGASDAAPPL